MGQHRGGEDDRELPDQADRCITGLPGTHRLDRFQCGTDHSRKEERIAKKYNKGRVLRRERAAVSISPMDGGDKRDRTANLLNAIGSRESPCSENAYFSSK
jgi:hypothetical protein